MSNSRKSVFITGASSGLGREMAYRFLRKKYNVLGVGRNVQALAKIKDDFPEQFEALVWDFSNPGSYLPHVKAMDPPDLLLFFAGYCEPGPIELVETNKWRNQFEVNLFSVLECLQALLPRLKEKQGVKILLPGSSAGRVVSPMNGPYASSKHALRAMADGLRLELKRQGIQVCLLEMGKLDTPYNETTAKTAEIYLEGEHLYKGLIQSFIQKTMHSGNLSLQEIGEKIESLVVKPTLPGRVTFDLFSQLLFFLEKTLPRSLYEYLVLSRASKENES